MISGPWDLQQKCYSRGVVCKRLSNDTGSQCRKLVAKIVVSYVWKSLVRPYVSMYFLAFFTFPLVDKVQFEVGN